MSNPPPNQKPFTPDYARPQPSRNNLWWKVLLRIIAGIVLGSGSVAGGFALAQIEPHLFFVVPGLVLAALIFVAVKYRRHGYVTGFIIAPFLIVAALIIYLLILCGNHSGKI